MRIMKEGNQRSSQIVNHYYILKGVGRFDNMKDLRTFIGVSRHAIRKLMEAGVIEKILI